MDFGPQHRHGPSVECIRLEDNERNIALGVLALIAAKRPGLRRWASVVIGLQFFLHAFDHLLDIDGADPRWLGIADFAALPVGVLVLAPLYWRIRGEAG